MSGPYGMYGVGEPEEVHAAQMQQQMGQQLPAQLAMFWQNVLQEMDEGCNSADHQIDFKGPGLPFARIKKIMRSDEDVRQMISQEAPVLFAKACELFILELTLRSWIHTEENKRKTLQRNDTALSISKTDTFDFLIDIVPRDDAKPPKKLQEDANGRGNAALPPELQQYYYQLMQHGQHQGPQHHQGQHAQLQHHQGQHTQQMQHVGPQMQHVGQHHQGAVMQHHAHMGQHQMGQHQMHHQMGQHQMGQHQMGQHQMGPDQGQMLGGARSVDPMILYQQQAAAQQMQSLRYLQQAQMMSQLQLQHQGAHDGDDVDRDEYGV